MEKQTEQGIQRLANVIGELQRKAFEEQQKQKRENLKAELQEAANLLKTMYDTYIEAGFDEEQALQIVIAFHNNAMNNPQKRNEDTDDYS